MSAANDNGSHSCSTVPPIGDGTLEHGRETRNMDGTSTEQKSLQALALKALKRNTERNTYGTSVFHQAAEKGPDVPPVFHDRMPDPRQLEAICRRAVADYPDVEPERLRRFLEVAEDPEWCSERVARHIARRMSEGLINET